MSEPVTDELVEQLERLVGIVLLRGDIAEEARVALLQAASGVVDAMIAFERRRNDAGIR